MPDVNTVAKMVLNDWLRGKIPYFVKPPGVSVHGSLALGRVGQLASTWAGCTVYCFVDVPLDQI